MRSRLRVLSLALGLALASSAWAADSRDFSARLDPPRVEGGKGDTVEVSVVLEFKDGPVAGWSVGVCTRDPAVARPTEIVSGAITRTGGPGGGPVAFLDENVMADGATQGVVVDFANQKTVPAGTYAVMKVRYALTAQPPAAPTCGEGGGIETRLDICDTAGTPAIRTVMIVGRDSILAGDRGPATLRVCPPIPRQIRLAMEFDPDARAIVANEADEASLDISIAVDDPAGLAPPLHALGWQGGVRHNAALLDPVSLASSGRANQLKGGAGPDFENLTIQPSGAVSGVTWGVIINLGTIVDTLPIPVGTGVAVLQARYRSAVTLRESDGDAPVSTDLAFSDDVGDPGIRTAIVIQEDNERSIVAGRRETATIALEPIADEHGFIRGDVNGDDRVDIADVIALLGYLFNRGAVPPCLDAADANDNERLQIEDPVHIVMAIFGLGTALDPFPECGRDADGRSLGCRTPNCE